MVTNTVTLSQSYIHKLFKQRKQGAYNNKIKY